MSRYYTQPKPSKRNVVAHVAVFIAITLLVLCGRAEAAEQVASVVTDGPELVYLPIESVKPISPSDSKCINKWRAIHYAAHAADVATTLVGSKNGAEEGNPLVRAILGKKPSVLGLIGIKAAAIGISEWQVHRSLKRLDGKGACRTHRVGAFITGGIAAVNFRYVF